MLDANEGQSAESYISELEDMLVAFYDRATPHRGTSYGKCLLCELHLSLGHRHGDCPVVTMESEFPNIVESAKNG